MSCDGCRGSVRFILRRVAVGHGWIWMALWRGVLGLAAGGEAFEPAEKLDQSWKVSSFVEDAELTGVSVFNLDFEKDLASSRYGNVWLATSDGLREFDGYFWRRYGRESGLPSEMVRCVLVTRRGELWVGTDQGAGMYDGRRFRSLGSEEGLPGPKVRRMVEDADGTIWFCCDSWPSAGGVGGLGSYRAGEWRRYRTAEGLPSDYVVNFHRDRSGRAWAATLSGLAVMEGGRWRTELRDPPGESFNWGSANLVETPGLGLVCSTGSELFFGQGGGWERVLPGRTPHEHGVCATGDGAMVAVGDVAGRRKAFFEWRSNDWVRLSADFRVSAGYVMDAREAPDGSVWTAGFNCLVRWPRRGGQWRELSGVPTPRWVDGRGAVWFAEQRALVGLGSRPVRMVEGERWERMGRSVDGVVLEPGGRAVWGWSSERVMRWEGTEEAEYAGERTGLATVEYGACDREGHFWAIGTRNDGEVVVVGFDGGRWLEPRAGAELRGTRRRWAVAAGAREGAWFVADDGSRTDAMLVYAGLDGTRAVPLPKEQVGLYRAAIHCDAEGRLWCYGDAGLWWWGPGVEGGWEAVTSLPARQVLGCVEREGELWFAYGGVAGGGNGLARYAEGRWLLHPLPAVHGLSSSGDGTVLAWGDGRFYRVLPGAEAPLMAVQLPIDDAVEAVVGDATGLIWVSAGGRVLWFRPDRVTPRVRLEGPGDVLVNGVMEARAEGIERFRPRGYRQDMGFRWCVDGGEWTALEQRSTWRIPLETLGVGEHRLAVMAVNASGDEAPIPAVMAFRVLPLPVQSRGWFLPLVAGALAVLAGLVAMAVSARRQLARHARTLEERVEERTGQLRALAAHLEAVREEERTAISREVHDGLGQMLSGLKMDLRWVSRRLEQTNDPAIGSGVRERMTEATELADATIAAVQRIALELRPGVLDALGLSDAIRDEARRFQDRSGLEVEVEVGGEVEGDRSSGGGGQGLDVDTVCFRVFQELLTNVARHSQARRVRVRLGVETGRDLVLVVEDDGVGFEPGAATDRVSLGLLGMSERAASVGGRFEIRRGEAGGTVAVLRVPRRYRP